MRKKILKWFEKFLPTINFFYRLVTLNFTANLSEMWLRVEARNPRGFRGKLLYRMAFDRRPILVLTTDKFLVRDFVKRRVGAEFLTELFGVYKPGDKISPENFPREFVVKANHACGGNVVVWSNAPEESELPINPRQHGWKTVAISPDKLEEQSLQALTDFWLSRDYSWDLGRRYFEWAYKDIPRRIIVEELLVGEDGNIPVDYKFFSFDGNVCFLEMHANRFSRHQCAIMTPDWKPVDATYASFDPIEPPPPRPKNLEKMVELASRLSEGFDFVRVDLFDLGDKVKFGELTHYHAGGTNMFKPPTFDDVLGSCWKLPELRDLSKF